MLRSLSAAAGALRSVVPGDYGSISMDLHLDGIQAGNLPALQGLLDLIGITAPIADVIDQLGLGGILGGVLPRTTTTSEPSSPSGTTTPSDGPGGGDDPDLLSLEGLLGGLTGGGA